MTRVVIFGNSGSGKSTRAKALASDNNLAHFDLDTIAWLPTSPPQRRAIAESISLLDQFLSQNNNWVIEGCYSDLLTAVLPFTEEIIFLNLPIESCVSNAKQRPWEPHKYESKAAQDANLNMLIKWISQYATRSDTFSKAAHEKLYSEFEGKKTMFTSNQASE
ncbi:shikimate kinase [Thalassotalea sp. M1531]|uniref:Shikimate kinase n=1 Tax=Thalassotalea algicola TaxID=2716224 RepID=A0A7Y0L997_9GAMM|nr:AAA family ATPase [Thalassotalea algicola]NMP30127.1 shikimate kinase [Thalassotalea algicola]